MNKIKLRGKKRTPRILQINTLNKKFNMQQQNKKSKHTSAVIDACYKRCTDNAI